MYNSAFLPQQHLVEKWAVVRKNLGSVYLCEDSNTLIGFSPFPQRRGKHLMAYALFDGVGILGRRQSPDR